MKSPATKFTLIPLSTKQVSAQNFSGLLYNLVRRMLKSGWSGPLAVASITAATFWSTLSNSWLNWDDNINVTLNQNLKLPLREFTGWALTDVGYVLRYKPINWFAWYTTAQLAGYDPAWFHLLNLTSHVVASAMLFVVLRRLLVVFGACQSTPTNAAAFMGAAWWALHPVRTEPVAWVSGFGYPLATCFFLGAILCYCRDGGIKGRPDIKVVVRTFALFVLSLMSYPAAFAGPITFLALDVAYRKINAKFTVPGLVQLWMKMPFFAVAILLLAITGSTRESDTTGWSNAPGFDTVGLRDRFGQGVLSYAHMAKRELMPQGLQVLYSDFNLARDDITAVAVAAIAVIGTAGLGLWSMRWNPLFGAGVFMFPVLILPYLGWTENQNYPSERYTYLPSLGLALAVAAAVMRGYALVGMSVRVMASIALTGVLASEAIITKNRIREWSNDEVFFNSAWESSIGGLRAVVGHRRSELFANSGRLEQALEAADASIECAPAKPEYIGWRANLHLRKGNHAAAKEDLHSLLRLRPDWLGAHSALAYIAASTEDWAVAEREAQHELVLALHISTAFAFEQRRFSTALLALAYVHTERAELAIEAIKPLLDQSELSPTVASLVAELANVLTTGGREREAALIRDALEKIQ